MKPLQVKLPPMQSILAPAAVQHKTVAAVAATLLATPRARHATQVKRWLRGGGRSMPGAAVGAPTLSVAF